MPRKPPEFTNHPIRYREAFELQFFRAHCCYVSDGDTSDFLVDLGWYQYAFVSVRLSGVDTAELRGTSGVERQFAERAKALAEQLVLDRSVLLRPHEVKTFDRHVADVIFEDKPSSFPELANWLDGASPDKGHWVSLAEVLTREKLTKADARR